MLPGPSVDEILTGSGVGAKINVMRGREVLAVGVPVKTVRESWTRDRDVPTEVTFTAPKSLIPTHPTSPLDNYGQRIQLISLIETATGVQEIEVGWFQIFSWQETSDGVDVTCRDLKQILADNPMQYPSSPPAGATLRSELQRLCTLEDGSGIPVILDVADRLIPRTFQWNVNRLDGIASLCETYGMVNQIRADGYLHAWEPADGSAPVARYSGKDLLLDAPRRSKDRIPNRFVVVGGSEDDEGSRFSAVAQNNAFPYDVEGYGVITGRTVLEPAVTQEQAFKAAQTRMRNALVVSEARSLEIITDRRIEGFDVISVTPVGEDPFVGRVVAFERTHDDPGASMRVDVEVLLW